MRQNTVFSTNSPSPDLSPVVRGTRPSHTPPPWRGSRPRPLHAEILVRHWSELSSEMTVHCSNVIYLTIRYLHLADLSHILNGVHGLCKRRALNFDNAVCAQPCKNSLHCLLGYLIPQLGKRDSARNCQGLDVIEQKYTGIRYDSRV